MASGLRQEEAIIISDDENEVSLAQERMSQKGRHFDARSEESLERKRFERLKLSLLKEDHRIDLPLQRPVFESLKPRHDSLDTTSSTSSNLDNHGCEGATPLDQEDATCPYYYDAKLELKMYRGPGFKQFHPVLGSMKGHQDICDRWDARQLIARNDSDLARAVLGTHNTTAHQQLMSTKILVSHTNGSSPEGSRGSLRLSQDQEQQWLEQILMVFPQVQHDFARALLRERHSSHNSYLASQGAADARVPDDVIAEIAEMETFPKQKELKRKHSLETLTNEDTTIQWDRTVLKNDTYYKEALILLAAEFNRIPTHFINKTLREKGGLYDTFIFLAHSENTYYNTQRKPYIRARLARVMLEKKYQRTAVEQREGGQYVNIVNEFQAARQQQHREETRKKRQRADEEAEANNFMVHQLQGSLVECQCCFNEAPINRVVDCENYQTHFFCNKCINMRAEEQVGVLRHEMRCMDTSGCGAELSKEALARALPFKISDKLAEIQQLAEIKAAGLVGLEQCPFCEYRAVCESVDVDLLFECLNPSCQKVSCRKCHGESHMPRTCEEAKKDKGLSARHAIEEARSEAMIRSCPRCNVKLIKSAGCNKMVCTNCSAVMCYVCKTDITGKNYEHFGSGATACPIQDQSAEDRHQREADDAETAAIAAAKAQDADVNEDDLRIEAHLNRQPARQKERPTYRYLHGERIGNVLPVLPQFRLMDVGQGLGSVRQHRTVPLIGQDAARTVTFANGLQIPFQNGRPGRMLVDHQQNLSGLLPFPPAPNTPFIPAPNIPLTTPNIPLMRGPFRPDHGVVPGLSHARQYSQNTYHTLAVEREPAIPLWNPLNGEGVGELAARGQHYLQRDLATTRQRDFVHNNDLGQHYRDIFPS